MENWGQTYEVGGGLWSEVSTISVKDVAGVVIAVDPELEVVNIPLEVAVVVGAIRVFADEELG
jgi:hypothetical protein